VETQGFLGLGQCTIVEHVSIIDNIFLSYNLVKHFVSPFLQKEARENFVKGQIMLEDWRRKKLPIFISKIS
jgi:hypothetical protein